MAELDAAIDRIEQGPSQWPPYLGGTRRYLLHRFPFFIVFRETASRIEIVAVAPTHAGALDTGLDASNLTVRIQRTALRAAADPRR